MLRKLAAHLVALSCLYFRWKVSALLVGISFQLLTTLMLKKVSPQLQALGVGLRVLAELGML
jgi:hypothetical protein